MSDGMIFSLCELDTGWQGEACLGFSASYYTKLAFHLRIRSPPILEIKMRYLEIFAGQWSSGMALLDGCRDWRYFLVAFGLIAFVCAKLVCSQHACVI